MFFPGKDAQQTMNHWNKTVNLSLVRGKWTKQEDEFLIVWVSKKQPTKWNETGRQLRVRSGKQCRERC